MARWSKLQSELYKIISDDIDFQIHCVAYRMDSTSGSTDIPRYWITIGKEIIWDYPKDFLHNKERVSEDWPYLTDISSISDLIREYIDSPKEGLLKREFANDKWGLTNILKASDKRIGKRQLEEWLKQPNSSSITPILKLRLKKWKFISRYDLTIYPNGLQAGDKVRIIKPIIMHNHLGRPTGVVYSQGEEWTILLGAQNEPHIIWLRQADGEKHTWDIDSFFETFEKITK